MDTERRIELIIRAPTEEVLVMDELKSFLETESKPTHYIGFEVSGFLHLGTLICAGMKVNDLIKAGVKCQIYLANWHSVINNKLGGDWESIKKAAKYYKVAFEFFCPGVEIVYGDKLYHNNDEYWKDVITFSKRITLARNTRCLTIMGRSEKDSLDMAQYYYPPMQAMDIKHIGARIAHGGTDQRKIHVLAREVYPSMKLDKPIAIHHHLLMGLQKPVEGENNRMEALIASKMSKSNPMSAIFVHDTLEQIKEKLANAWCPEITTNMNPVIDYMKYVVFRNVNDMVIDRPAKFGGKIEIQSYEELEKKYVNGEIHPMDLKNACAEALDKIIAPVRKHFEKPSNKKLLEVYKQIQITR